MHHNPIDILNFSSSSVFSSQEYKIDSGNLHITDLSLGRNDKEIIPLDLIDPEPRISKKNNEQLVWASIATFTIGLLFIVLSMSVNAMMQQTLGFGLLGISAILFIASLKLQTTSYTYYYANTATHLFTINEPQSSESDHAKKFVQSLNQRINKPNLSFQRKTKKENYSDFLEHLDFLYNYGVLTDNQYERIHSKINVKIYGNIDETVCETLDEISNKTRKSADIIPLPLRKL
ncbi:MAG TPA: hypothetical protein EYH20_04020 [Leucothrix sp.]|nr:hypothetical protein [Leucothrix sp.]